MLFKCHFASHMVAHKLQHEPGYEGGETGDAHGCREITAEELLVRQGLARQDGATPAHSDRVAL